MAVLHDPEQAIVSVFSLSIYTLTWGSEFWGTQVCPSQNCTKTTNSLSGCRHLGTGWGVICWTAEDFPCIQNKIHTPHHGAPITCPLATYLAAPASVFSCTGQSLSCLRAFPLFFLSILNACPLNLSTVGSISSFRALLNCHAFWEVISDQASMGNHQKWSCLLMVWVSLFPHETGGKDCAVWTFQFLVLCQAHCRCSVNTCWINGWKFFSECLHF